MAFDEYAFMERMVRIETKLDEVLKQADDKEIRLRFLEKAIGKIIGFSMVFGAAVGAAFMMLKDAVGK